MKLGCNSSHFGLKCNIDMFCLIIEIYCPQYKLLHGLVIKLFLNARSYLWEQSKFKLKCSLISLYVLHIKYSHTLSHQHAHQRESICHIVTYELKYFPSCKLAWC